MEVLRRSVLCTEHGNGAENLQQKQREKFKKNRKKKKKKKKKKVKVGIIDWLGEGLFDDWVTQTRELSVSDSSDTYLHMRIIKWHKY